MSYASITVAERLTMDDYRTVAEHLGAEPAEGLLTEVAGRNDAGLHVITVWDTKADHERFVNERLIPAFEAAALPTGPMSFTGVDLGAVWLRAKETTSH
jgi:hypothetical protein